MMRGDWMHEAQQFRDIDRAVLAKIDARQARREVRNPVLALPGVRRLLELDRDSQAALRAVLKDIQADARQRADKCWRTHKAPMAAYWKAVSVYAGHVARTLSKGSKP